MALFVMAVEQMQDRLREHLEADDECALAPERRREAEVVEPCAVRFVEGEMDPSRKLAVGRVASMGPVGAPPSLAEKLGGKLSSADEDTLDAVRLAVHKALAVGYLFTAQAHGRDDVELPPERTTEDMWEFWVDYCRVKLEDEGFPEDWAETVRHMGADLLVAELKAPKLTRFLGGSKLNQLGMIYAQAGVHLRSVQGDELSDDAFREVVRVRREMPDRPWQFDDYAGA